MSNISLALSQEEIDSLVEEATNLVAFNNAGFTQTKKAERRQRTLELLRTEPLHLVTISVFTGTSKIQISFENLGLKPDVVEKLRSRHASPPTIQIFPALDSQANILRSHRAKLQKTLLLSWEPFWVCHSSNLPKLNEEIDLLSKEVAECRSVVFTNYQQGRKDFFARVVDIAQDAGLNTDEVREVLLKYRSRFPTLERLQQSFRVEVFGPIYIPSLVEQAEEDSRLAESLLKDEETQALRKLRQNWTQQLQNGFETMMAEARDSVFDMVADSLQTLESKQPGDFSPRAIKTLEKTIERLEVLTKSTSGNLGELAQQLSEAVKTSQKAPLEGGHMLLERLSTLRQSLRQEMEEADPTRSGHRNVWQWLED